MTFFQIDTIPPSPTGTRGTPTPVKKVKSSEPRTTCGIGVVGCTVQWVNAPLQRTIRLGDEILAIDGVNVDDRTIAAALIGSDVVGSKVLVNIQMKVLRMFFFSRLPSA